MKYVSVCAGIEAATVAWHPLGWTPVLFSEIEPFPCAVLRHRYPEVPLVGDFTTLLTDPPAADLLVGGTPCQSFSIAGKRLSLEDYRGNLSLAFADLFHAGQYPFAVWENVPGVLSTKDNAFGCFLGRLVGSDTPLVPGTQRGRWSGAGVVSGPQATAAWRVLDAQYFGVAQRRRRVFVCVARGAGNGAAVRALLPVAAGVPWHPPARRQTGEDLTGTLGARTSGGDGLGGDFECSGGVVAPTVTGGPPFSRTGNARVECEAVIVAPVASTLVSPGQQWNSFQNLPNLVVSHDPAVTLTAREAKGPLPEADLSTVIAIQERAVSSNPDNGPGGIGVRTDGVAYTLEARTTPQAVSYLGLRPRRLTPRECERLQGFPDDYTLIPWGKKSAPDTLRYRALGNSMAVPVMRWIGRQLDLMECL